MPAKDIFHNLVKHALEKEGWKITHENYHIQIDDSDFFIDLAAEKVLAAEKDGSILLLKLKAF